LKPERSKKGKIKKRKIMANYFLDGPDELAKMEFISRQKLLQQDRIMRDKINNYVQLVHALTGQEVIMPIANDEYSFVSVSSDEYEELVLLDDDETIEYVEVEDLSDVLLESDRIDDPTPHGTQLKIENLDLVREDSLGSVNDPPPPTPSGIIRKLKAALVQAGMCQIRNTKRKFNKRISSNNWSYDMARRRLDRELRRIQKRRAYIDATERLPTLARKRPSRRLSFKTTNANARWTMPSLVMVIMH